MKIRSPSLLGLSLALLAGSASLAIVLERQAPDSLEGHGDQTALVAGEPVGVEGDWAWHRIDPATRPLWAGISPLLDNYTYVLKAGPSAGDEPPADPAVVHLATGAMPRLATEDVLVEGTVLYSGPHPEMPGTRLVLLSIEAWRPALLR